MESYLYKINCSTTLEDTFTAVNVFSVKNTDEIEISKLNFLKSKIILCININNSAHLDQVIEQSFIENLNVPTIFILSEQNEQMIKKLYSKHQINICFRSQPEILLREQIQYMFNNYSFFTGLKSKTILNQINTSFFTKKEVEIIRLLAESPLKELNRSELFTRVWGKDSMNTNTLDVHLCNIRKKLKTSAINISSIQEGRVALLESH